MKKPVKYYILGGFLAVCTGFLMGWTTEQTALDPIETKLDWQKVEQHQPFKPKVLVSSLNKQNLWDEKTAKTRQRKTKRQKKKEWNFVGIISIDNNLKALIDQNGTISRMTEGQALPDNTVISIIKRDKIILSTPDGNLTRELYR